MHLLLLFISSVCCVALVSGSALAASSVSKPVSLLEPKRPSSTSHRNGGGSDKISVQQIQIDVGYPAKPMEGRIFTIRGSFPLSWESGIKLTQKASSTYWTFSAPTGGPGFIWGNATNATFFEMDFKILVDDEQYSLGRNYRFTILRDGAAIQKMRVCPYFTTTKSQTMTYDNLHSPQLNNSRSVWLYIPAMMVENTVCHDGVQLLVMGDGQNLGPLWNLQQHLDAAIIGNGPGTQTTGPILVLGPYNMDAMRIYEYTMCACAPYTTSSLGDLYLDFLEQTLIPFFASKFPLVDFSPANRGLGGSSLGGLIAAYAGVTRPQSWTTIVAMSSSFWWCYIDASKPEAFLHQYLPKMTTAGAARQTWYMDTGGSGPGQDDQHETSRVITTMTLQHGGRVRNGQQEVGQNVYWNLQRNGFHNEAFWSARFPRVLEFTYGRNGLNNDW